MPEFYPSRLYGQAESAQLAHYFLAETFAHPLFPNHAEKSVRLIPLDPVTTLWGFSVYFAVPFHELHRSRIDERTASTNPSPGCSVTGPPGRPGVRSGRKSIGFHEHRLRSYGPTSAEAWPMGGQVVEQWRVSYCAASPSLDPPAAVRGAARLPRPS